MLLKKISISGIITAIILVIIGGFLLRPLSYIGVGIILGIFLNNIFLKIENSIGSRNQSSSVTSQNLQTPNTDSFKYSIKLTNKYTQLKECFNEYRSIDLFSELATTSLIQLERSLEKFERFIVVLSNKFNPQELAYSKFYITVEQVYMAILENLDLIENKLKGVGGKDYYYLINRLDGFEKMPQLTKAQFEEMSSIRQKKGMVKKEVKAINEILATTENVISNLDKILMETSNLKTSSSTLDVKGNYAIIELEQLIKNAKMYNIG